MADDEGFTPLGCLGKWLVIVGLIIAIFKINGWA